MTMTTNPTIPIPSAPLGSWVRRHLTWVLVVIAFATTIAVVAAIAAAEDTGTDEAPAVSDSVTDVGTGGILDQSIVAREQVTVSQRPDSLVDQSIVSREHAAQIGRDHEQSRDARMAAGG